MHGMTFMSNVFSIYSVNRCVTNCEKRKVGFSENYYVNFGSSFKLNAFITNRVLGVSYKFRFDISFKPGSYSIRIRIRKVNKKCTALPIKSVAVHFFVFLADADADPVLTRLCVSISGIPM